MFSSIRNQLILFGVLAAVVIALIAGIGLYAVRQVQGALENTVRSALMIRNHIVGDMLHDSLRSDVLAGQIAGKEGKPAEIAAAAQQVDEHFKEFMETLNANLKVQLSPEIDALLKASEPEVKLYGATAKALMKDFSTDFVAAERKVPVFNAQFLKMEISQAATRDKIEAFVLETEKTSQVDSRNSLRLVALSSFLALMLVGTFSVLLFRRITRPLEALRSVVERVNAGDMQARAQLNRTDELGEFSNAFDKLLDERIAGLNSTAQENEQLNESVLSVLQAVNQLSQRDLTVRAPVTQDVIGTVSDSINALTDATSKVLRGVTLIAGSVAQASGKVKSQADLVSKTAQEERRGVAEMVEALTGATQSMNNVGALAEQSNRSAERATQATHTALETVNGTVKGMESIRETIAETEKRIKRLGERSQEITGIVNLINTISERTHVLALNASMQAAVAGEAGRGFAVVAEEVQRLAESSRNATQQISTLVNNIQLETNETISTVNRTIGQVVQGSEQAQKAGEQMRLTQEITGELVAQVRRIGEASAQQKEMSAQLLLSVQRIGQSTERTALQIDAQNEDTESLLDSARRLVESVNVFKLPQLA
jgi:twitching motility protein PilJ